LGTNNGHFYKKTKVRHVSGDIKQLHKPSLRVRVAKEEQTLRECTTLRYT